MKIETANQIKNEISNRYDLPELAQAEFQTSGSSDTKQCKVTITPRGQMAGLVRKLEVQLTVSTSPTQLGPLYRVNLEFDYNHQGGGHNGFDRRLVAVVSHDNQFGDTVAKVLDIIEEETMNFLYRWIRN